MAKDGVWDIFEQVGDSIYKIGSPVTKLLSNTIFWIILVVGMLLYFVYGVFLAHTFTWGYLLLVICAIVVGYLIYRIVSAKVEEH